MKVIINTRVLVSITAALLILVVACGSSDEQSSASPASAATTGSSPTTTPPTNPATIAEPPSQGPRSIGQVQGVTFEIGEGSVVTFTVNEKLAQLPLPGDAVVRTTALSGEVNLDGRASIIEIDLHQLRSDQSKRDGYIRQRMFPRDPIAVITIEDIGQLPSGFADGETVMAQVAANLNIQGADVPLTFDVEARDDGDVVFILGRTTFTWDQIKVRAPNIRGIVQVQDEVRVEVLLVATPKSPSGG